MRYARTILGYHGCDASVAEEVLAGRSPLRASENAYDWLGRGIYFWEHGPERALQWATAQAERDASRPPTRRAPITHPAVVGAVIHLGRCFDLLDLANTAALAQWVPTYRQGLEQAGEVFPENEGREPWRLLRKGDCAVINSFLALREDEGVHHDSVRGCFLEGEPIYPRSGIYTLAHIQVAVRDPTCIAGVFRPTL
jgi:hypothetical protein